MFLQKIPGSNLIGAARKLLFNTLLLAALLPAPLQQAQQNPTAAPLELTPLAPGKSMTRDLAGGEEHIYQISLSKDQYVRLIIEQRGIDVVVHLQEGEGKPAILIDSEYRSQGEEQVEIAAEITGSHKLYVRAGSVSAPTGQYVIRVAEIRAATENDRLLNEARQLEADYRGAIYDGKYENARAFVERALTISENLLGSEHPYVAKLLYRLGDYYEAKQDFAKSEALHERALSISEKTLGQEHEQTIEISRSLAYLYYEENELDKAQRLADRAVALSQKMFGPEHHFAVKCLFTQAQVRRSAEQLMQRLLPIAEKIFGETLLTGDVLNELGIRYTGKGDYQKAEPFLLRAQSIYEKRNGPDNLDQVVNLHNLGMVARGRKDYAKAEQYYQKAIAIVEKAFGPENPRLAVILNNIANIYRAKGEYLKSLEAHLRVLRISEKTLGPYHPLTLNSLGNIAKTYAAQASIAEAIKFQSRVDVVIERNIEMNLAIGSERQKLSYLNGVTERTDRTISLNAGLAPSDSSASALAALVLLQRKGRVLDAMSASFASLRERSTADEHALLQQYSETTAQLARLVLNGPQKLSFEEHQKKVSDLEERKESLEAEISRRSAEFRAASQPVTLAAIQAALPANAALVEFAIYRPFDPKAESNSEAYKDPRYIVYLLRQKAEVAWRDLGDVQSIDKAVGALRQALRDPLRRDVYEIARSLDERIMRPVRSLAGEATRLLVSPDGALNLIPFEALVDEQGRYLIQRYSFAYLTSGRDLLRMGVARESRSQPVVVADPAFGQPATVAAPADAGRAGDENSKVKFDQSQVFFGPLPGVAAEVRALRDLLPQATFLTKEQATKAALKQVHGPSILHIATHGFFLQNDPRVRNRATARTGDTSRLGKVVANVENPLLRSGLALAGANQGPSGNDDGVLTALEAADLDLWGTKLVVLSACDTGVGEVKSGEGVYGLRRALVLAGAESQVMSLWPVSDRSTRDLMIGYYKGLAQNEGRGDALRRVQLQMLRGKARSHPYYWASFILAGEWANLKGQR